MHETMKTILTVLLLSVLVGCSREAPSSGAQYALVGDELTLDDRYFAVKRSNLEEEGRMARSVAKRKANAKSLCSLARQATNTVDVSNTTRLSVMASATEAVYRYVRAMPHPSKDLEEFAVSSEILDPLFLLEIAADMLSRIPKPDMETNVEPPLGTPGPCSGGMDPAGIKDPKYRAEYEKRIADNKAVWELGQSRSRLQQAAASLQDAFRTMILGLTAAGKAESIRTAVSASKLPTEIKVYILADEKPKPGPR
jgi:hypothetical protein